MKKIIIFLSIIIITLSGCQISSAPESNKIKIVTTVFPVYDFAKNICSDMAEVSMLVPPGSDVHSYEPTPADIINLAKADLFIYIGGETEVWVKDILKSAEIEKDKLLNLQDVIEFIPYETEHHHKEYDEHIWTSVKNASEICNAMTQKICEADKENSEKYKTNYYEYNEKLNALDKEFTEITKNSVRKTVVFGDRFPFLYFVRDYGLSYYSAFPGCSSETEPSASVIAELTDKIKKENIPIVFHLEFSNEKIADILCENTGAEKRQFHSCHTVTAEEIKNGISYIELMEKNAENLKEALN